MSSEKPNSFDNQEIDLGQLTKGISNFYQKLLIKIFKTILYVKRNILAIAVLLILGIVLGTFIDNKIKNYDHKILVLPNFKSTDYLYSKINLLNSKIKERDTNFLKKIGVQDIKSLNNIEVEPVVDIYSFIQEKKENFDLLKLMAEDGNMDKILIDKTTSKNYKFHTISFSTSKITDTLKTINPILSFLNDNSYFKNVQKEYLNNNVIKIKENDSLINQINGLMKEFSNKANGSSNNDKLVYYNENTQLNDVIKTKESLINENGYLRLEQINQQKIVKDISATLNILNTKSINGKLKLILPLLFIFGFVLISAFISFYKKQSLKQLD